MRFLLIKVLFLARALSLPTSPSSMSALFSAIPTSGVPTTSSSALFSAIPTTIAPSISSASTSSGTAVPAVVFEYIPELLTSDDEDDDGNDDDDDNADNRPFPIMNGKPPDNNASAPHNKSIDNQTGSGPSPYHHPYQPHQRMNHTAPYLNLTSTSTSNTGNNGDDDDDDATALRMSLQSNENTEGDENDDEINNDDNEDEIVLPTGPAPVTVSTGSSNSTSTADLIPDSRIEA